MLKAFWKTVPCETFHHLPSGLVVVQVHEAPGVFLNLPGIHKAPRELHAVLDIGWAAAPLPPFLLVLVVALLLTVAAALAEVALAAGRGDSVCYTRRRNGVGKRRLSAACGGWGSFGKRSWDETLKKDNFSLTISVYSWKKVHRCDRRVAHLHLFCNERDNITKITCLAFWLKPPAKTHYNSDRHLYYAGLLNHISQV